MTFDIKNNNQAIISILGCVFGRNYYNKLIINIVCGAGGIRTLVQTRKS